MLKDLDKVIIFSTKSHGDQLRKYTGEPYITHPISVAKRLEKLGFDDNVLSAAILHDTVEDTPTTLQDIKDNFGDRISKLVEELTDIYTKESYPNINRRERKRLEFERLSKVSNEAKSIKLSDIIDNLPSIMEGDIGFGRVYLKEKESLLESLKGGDERLYKEAQEMILKYKNA